MITFREWVKIREDVGEVSQKAQGNADYCTNQWKCSTMGAPRSKYVASMKKKMKKGN